MSQDEELQEPEEEGLGDVPFGHEVRLESEIRARAVSVPRQFTPQRPERPFSFMTPQVPKANSRLSLADRVRGRKSMGGFGQAGLGTSLQVTEVVIRDVDQGTPSTNAEPGQRRVSESERKVGLIPQLQTVPL